MRPQLRQQRLELWKQNKEQKLDYVGMDFGDTYC